MARDDCSEELRTQFLQLIELANKCAGLKGGKARRAALKEAWKHFESYERSHRISDLLFAMEFLSEFIMG